MFCPSCGKSEQSAYTYCRSCGIWLADFTKKKHTSFGGNTPQENVNVGLFLNSVSSLAGFLSAIALYWTFLGIEGAPPVVYLVAAFYLCIGFWQASNVYIGLKLRKRFTGQNAVEARGLEEANKFQALPQADTSEMIKPRRKNIL